MSHPRSDDPGAAPANATAGAVERRHAERADRAVLEERARALARRVETVVPTESLELLVFHTARERLAVETRFVLGVFRLMGLTPLPGAEAPVRGLTAWRGEVLTLLDARPFFGASTTALDDLAHAVVVGDGRARYGLLADEIVSIIQVPLADIFPPRSSPTPARTVEFTRGVTRDAVLVLDAAKLLQSL
jgi:purine-binding chemotaxis protein CheW